MKTIFVTGSTDGIGLRTAERLAGMGYNLILHGRKKERCESALNKINSLSHGEQNHSYFIADFSSLNDVKSMAYKIKENIPSIDVLINNAGIYMNDFELTADGFEATFQVNHLAPFLLTNILIDKINSNGGRIVNVSSIAHTRGAIDLNNLNGEKGYNAYFAYAQSKFANVLFTYKLARMFEPEKITSNCLHPGVISTKLLHAGFNIEGNDLNTGSDTSVYLATSQEVEGITGKYFDRMKAVESHPSTYDIELQDRFWNKTEELLAGFMNK